MFIFLECFFHFGSYFGQASLTLGKITTEDANTVAPVKFTKLTPKNKNGYSKIVEMFPGYSGKIIRMGV